MEEIVLKTKGQFLAESIAVRIRGMLPQQFNTAGNFIMVGNPQMNAVEAKRYDARGLRAQHVLNRQWRPVVDLGVVQVGDRRQSKCALEDTPERPHEPQLRHLVQRGQVLNRVAGVVVGRNRKAKFPRWLGTGTISIVLDRPAIGTTHPLFLLPSLSVDREFTIAIRHRPQSPVR